MDTKKENKRNKDKRDNLVKDTNKQIKVKGICGVIDENSNLIIVNAK